MAGMTSAGEDLEAVVSGQSDALIELEETVEKLASTTIPEMSKELRKEIRAVLGPTIQAAERIRTRPTNLTTLYASHERLRVDIRAL